MQAYLNRFWYLALLLLAGCSGVAQGDPVPASKNLKEEQAGYWQMYTLPSAWLHKQAEHYKIPQLKKAQKIYLSIQQPHIGDIDLYGACFEPHRLVFGIVYNEEKYEERLHSCFDYCGAEDLPGSMYKGLWGKDSKLTRVDVALGEKSILLTEIYHQRSTQEVKNGPRAARSIQAESRKWKREIPTAEIFTKTMQTMNCLGM